MHRGGNRGRITVALTALGAALAAAAFPAAAHETRAQGAVRLTIGWAQEPVFSGMANAVEVEVADANGTPIGDIGGSLTVQVSFGDAVVTLALLPASPPGTFTAALVPTRAGTYTFHVMGTVKEQVVDARSTCSERTFDCVVDVAAIQFPAKDVEDDRLAERLDRESRRLRAASDTATTARLLSLVGLVLAAAALVVAVILGRRRSHRSE